MDTSADAVRRMEACPEDRRPRKRLPRRRGARFRHWLFRRAARAARIIAARALSINAEGKVASEHRYGELGTVMTQVGGAGAKAKPRPIPAIPPAPETIMSTGTPDEEKNVEIAKSVLASLEAGDFLMRWRDAAQ